jgi:hypothetical protein
VIRRCVFPPVVVFALSVFAAYAATDVTVRVTNRQGQTLSNVRVSLTLVESYAPRPPWMVIPSQTTGLDGQATFPRLEPGVYATSIIGVTDPFLMSPISSGTDASQGRFTVRDEERLTVPVALARGDQITVEFRYDITDDVVFEFSFVELATGMRLNQRLIKTTRTKVLLPVGRWRLEFRSPPGLVFRSLEFDGVTVPLASDTLEITEGGRQRFVTFTFTGPCFVRAHVWASGGEPPDLTATQLSPGALTTAATAVGAPPLTPVRIPQEWPRPTYHGWLPDGVWRIAPTSERLESSEPPFIDVDCTSTPQHSLEFTTRMRNGDGPAREDRLRITVLDPNDNALDDAVVEVYLPETVDNNEEPIARSRTSAIYPGARPEADFTGLPRKALVIVAGHAKWIDANVVVPEVDPKKENPQHRSASVRLGAGATVEVDALKPDGTAAEGVSLGLDRQEPAMTTATRPSRLVQDEALRERKAHLGARTDATGRARITGIEPGSYIARGAHVGSGDTSYIVQVREGEQEPADTLTLKFQGTERTKVTVVLRAAASVVAEMICDDGGALPLKLDARLLAPDRDAPWRTTLPVGELAAPLHPLNGRAVGGPETNRLRLGPLKPGEYCLAIRPAGFDRWTFAGSGDDPSRSMRLQLREGQEVDLGVWTIPCRTSLLLVARPIGDVKAPDLSHATATATIAASKIRVDREAAERRGYRALEPLPLLRALRLYGVPNEPVNVALRVHDRFLLPESISPLPNPLALDLERGREETVPLQFEALAGSLDIAVDAPAARAISVDGTITRIERDERAGLLRAGPLRPGVYSVDVCADPACARVTHRFGDVTVTALSVTVLPPAK